MGGYGLAIGNAVGSVGNHLLEQVNCTAWMDGGFTFESSNAWHHIGLVHQNANDDFYADGQLVAIQCGPIPTPPRVFWIGALADSPILFIGRVRAAENSAVETPRQIKFLEDFAIGRQPPPRLGI